MSGPQNPISYVLVDPGYEVFTSQRRRIDISRFVEGQPVFLARWLPSNVPLMAGPDVELSRSC